jgi:hypothetical protein
MMLASGLYLLACFTGGCFYRRYSRREANRAYAAYHRWVRTGQGVV